MSKTELKQIKNGLTVNKYEKQGKKELIIIKNLRKSIEQTRRERHKLIIQLAHLKSINLILWHLSTGNGIPGDGIH